MAKEKAESHHDVAVWIMALGIAFALALFLTAIFNANPWEDHTYQVAPPIVAGMPAPHKDGREEMVCSSCHIVTHPKTVSGAPPGAVLPIVEGTPAPHKDGREKMNCAMCHTIIPRSKPVSGPARTVPAAPAAPVAAPQTLPVAMPVVMPQGAAVPAVPLQSQPPITVRGGEEENLPTYRFQGKVLKLAGTGSQSVWGDVFILLDDGINDPTWIDLAPRWYLQAGGCHLRAGMFVKGMAFRDANADGPTPSYGMSLLVNGEFCGLRDREMRGLWTRPGGNADAE